MYAELKRFTTWLIGILVLWQVYACTPPGTQEQVMEVTQIEFVELDGKSGTLKVVVKGVASTPGWSNPELIPHVYIQPPQNGIYGFDFVATPPPPDKSVIQVLTPIEAEYVYQALPAGFRGVMVQAAQNQLEAIYNPGTGQLESILKVDGIDFVRGGNDASLTVIAQGTTATEGWTHPQLVPFQYIQPPTDGVYDFTFMAIAPNGPVATVLTPISAKYFYESVPSNLKGIRIHASENVLERLLEPAPPPAQPRLVMQVDAIDLAVMESFPPQLRITAHGSVNSGGWTDPVLVPVEPAKDGVYSFLFQARPPEGGAAGAIMKIQATHVLSPMPNDLTAVRIVAENNELLSSTQGTRDLIYRVDAVTLSAAGNRLSLHIAATASSTGWGNFELVPYTYIVPPQDGIYDFSVYAQRLQGVWLPVLTPVSFTTTIPYNPGGDMVGVRIHGKTGEPIVQKIP